VELGDQVELILTHPNGWNVIQQRFLQKAVVAAELIPASAVKTRLHFLEESEASTSFCMAVRAELADSIQVRSNEIHVLSAYPLMRKKSTGRMTVHRL